VLLQGDLGLNIREAHVFNTTDGFALDVFVVDGWNNDVSTPSDWVLTQGHLGYPQTFPCLLSLTAASSTLPTMCLLTPTAMVSAAVM
jgi:hypothetical protein